MALQGWSTSEGCLHVRRLYENEVYESVEQHIMCVQCVYVDWQKISEDLSANSVCLCVFC